MNDTLRIPSPNASRSSTPQMRKSKTIMEIEISDMEENEEILTTWEAWEREAWYLVDDRKKRHVSNHDKKLFKKKIGQASRADIKKLKANRWRRGSVDMSMSNEEPTLKQARL